MIIAIPKIRSRWRCEIGNRCRKPLENSAEPECMPYQNLIYEKKEHVGTVTFNRPKVLNALNRQTMDELDALLTEARNDKDLRVLIFTGAGDKAFIAGADINELPRMTPTTGPETSLYGQAVLHTLETMGKPSIAAV